MNRRILLIDADPTFRDTLKLHVGKYRFDIVAEPDADKALAGADSPALLIVAVEEPDKAGFKVFQRCKKGALAKTPMLLVTSTVAPDSFAKHRSLKVHADEYLDKRSMSRDELLGKIDNLVGLGEISDDELDIPVEVDDIPLELADGDMVLDETVGEDFDKASVDAETDAAFAALVDVEPAPQAVPAPIHDAGKTDDSGVFDTFSRESMQPPLPAAIEPELSPPPAPELEQPTALMMTTDDLGDEAVPEEVPHPSERSYSSAPIAVVAEDPPEPEPPPPPPPAPEPEPAPKPRFIEATTSSGVRPAIDLGLDAIAQDADRDQSGVYDRRALRKIGELERQIQQLKTELERARQSADQSRGGGRERDFLNLRETIIAKDSELGKLRADVASRDREILDARDKLRAAQQARTTAESRATELDGKLAAGSTRLAAAETAQRTATGQLATLGHELDTRTATATAAETARQQLQRELAAERARAAAGASESERMLRLEREQLIARHQHELTTARGEAAAALETAVTALRDELESGHGLALKAAVTAAQEEARAAVIAKHAADAAKLVDDHTAELERLRGEHRGAFETARGEHADEIARVRAGHDTALAEIRDEHAALVASTTQAGDQAVAAATAELERHKAQLATLAEQHEAELVAARAELSRELQQQSAALEATKLLADKHEADLATVAAEHHHELVAAAEQHLGTVERLEAERAELVTTHESTVAELTAKHGEALAAARASSAESLVAASATHGAELEALVAEHAEVLEQRDRDHATARAADSAEAAAAIRELKLELERQKAVHDAKLDDASRELDAAIARHEQDKARLDDEHRRASEAAIAAAAAGHADELARLDEQRAATVEDVKRAAAEHAGAADRQLADLHAQLHALRDEREREAAEHVAALRVAKRMVEEAVAKHQTELAQAIAANDQALADHKATHERALAVALGDHTKQLAVARNEHRQAVEALTVEHDRYKATVGTEHGKVVADLTGERDELRRGLSSTRDALKRSESELGSAVQTIGDRNADLRGHAAAINERDQRIAELRKEIESLEQENASYQEQVLRAYQKIKADEAMVARARKAMAIALTVLDDQGNPTS